MPDLTYAADVLVWALVWSAAGLVGRQLIANGDARRDARQHGEHSTGKAGR